MQSAECRLSRVHMELSSREDEENFVHVNLPGLRRLCCTACDIGGIITYGEGRSAVQLRLSLLRNAETGIAAGVTQERSRTAQKSD